MLRTSGDAQHAECAAPKIIHILVKLTLFLSVGQFNHLCSKLDGAVGTVHLADAASYALMASLIIVDKGKLGAETLTYLKCLTVLGITFSYFRSHKLLACNLHSLDEAGYATANTLEIFFYTTHSLSVKMIISVPVRQGYREVL